MNIILAQGIQYTIPDTVVEHTPYFKTLIETNINKDMKEDSYVLKDITLRDISIYCRFIDTCEIKGANIDTLLHISDYLGNKLPINHGYSKDYHIVLIKDWWIDNIGHDLIQTQKVYGEYSRNEHIRFLNDMIGEKQYYIAGGYATSMLLEYPLYGDVDVYLKNNADVDKIELYCNNNNIPYKIHKHVINIRYMGDIKPIQIILDGPYEYMSDIISQFDLDSCCIIFYDGIFYTNNRGEYAIKNKVNNFRPEMYSERYSSRLLKYLNRGFKISLPNFVPLMDLYSMCHDINLCNINNYIEEEYDDNDKLIIYCSFNIQHVGACSNYSGYASNDTVLSIPIWEKDIFTKYRIPLESMEQFYSLTTLKR